MDDGAAAALAFDLQRAAVLFDQPAADRQAETGAAFGPRLVGVARSGIGEQGRGERAVALCRRHAVTGILDLDADAVALPCCTQRDPAAARAELDRIAEQVDQDL